MAPAAHSSGLGSSSYGRVSTNAISIANQLRELGVSSEIQLPTLVTAGNQSSGKSSVVEAITGLLLPRAAGTCTRASTEVRMRRAKPVGGGLPWQCIIKLKREYDASGIALTEVPQEEVFCTITRQQDVTMCVSAAQATLLNPHTVSAKGNQVFLPSGLGTANPRPSPAMECLSLPDTDSELEFTPNSVVLEIQGAEADLTIVDLPGIIQSHPKGESYVDMIKQMVIRTIEQDHVIIAMTLTAMDDLENQAINLEARKVDPEGRRMIGIVTKPDMIPDGEAWELTTRSCNHQKWVTLAKNQSARNFLTMGYYVVKNPGQAQLDKGITSEEARQLETDFFARQPFWREARAEISGRMGSDNLRNALSDMLVKRILQEMPAMLRLARTKLKETEDLILQLPPPPTGEVHFELSSLLNKVAHSLHDEVRACGSGNKLTYQRLSSVYATFESALKASLPAFVVKAVTVSVLESVPPGKPAWTLEQVQQLRAKHMGRELPSFSPYSAVEELISTFKGQLREAVDVCLASAKEELQGCLKGCVDATFSQFTGMLPLLNTVMTTELEKEARVCMERLQRVTSMEDRDIFTLNSHYFTESMDAFLSRLKMASLGVDNAWLASCKNAYEADILSKLGCCGIRFTGLEKIYLAQPTPEDDELKMMAATLGYFKVVYKRILDEVPMHIREYLLHEFADKEKLANVIYQSTLEELKQAGTDLGEMLAEDGVISGRRRQLSDLQSRLAAAVRVLEHPTRCLVE